MRYISFQRISPVRKTLESGSVKHLFGQAAVRRAFRLPPVRIGRNRRNLGINACQPYDLPCKLIPCTFPLIGSMVYAIFLALYHIRKERRQVARISGRSDLVVYYL